jgi:hypothetical protein
MFADGFKRNGFVVFGTNDQEDAALPERARRALDFKKSLTARVALAEPDAFDRGPSLPICLRGRPRGRSAIEVGASPRSKS